MSVSSCTWLEGSILQTQLSGDRPGHPSHFCCPAAFWSAPAVAVWQVDVLIQHLWRPRA